MAKVNKNYKSENTISCNFISDDTPKSRSGSYALTFFLTNSLDFNKNISIFADNNQNQKTHILLLSFLHVHIIE